MPRQAAQHQKQPRSRPCELGLALRAWTIGKEPQVLDLADWNSELAEQEVAALRAGRIWQ